MILLAIVVAILLFGYAIVSALLDFLKDDEPTVIHIAADKDEEICLPPRPAHHRHMPISLATHCPQKRKSCTPKR